jgi:hypothetical protein
MVSAHRPIRLDALQICELVRIAPDNEAGFVPSSRQRAVDGMTLAICGISLHSVGPCKKEGELR